MDIASTTLVERIARVQAAHQLSKNGEGNMISAGEAVDDLWPDHIDAAFAVLRTLREPSVRMVEVGDVAVWERMVLAALEESPST